MQFVLGLIGRDLENEERRKKKYESWWKIYYKFENFNFEKFIFMDSVYNRN